MDTAFYYQLAMLSLADITGWLKLIVYISIAVVGAIYVYQVFLPGIKSMMGSEPDYAERAAELMNEKWEKEHTPDEHFDQNH